MSASETFSLPSGVTSERPASGDALAYATLECARLGCEQLLERARTPLLVRLLRAAHRELGMSAYLAGAELPVALRQHLLACAKWCAPESGAYHGATEDLLMLSIRGADVTAVLRSEPRLGDEVSLAHAHVLDAISALTALVGAERAHTLAVEAMFRGKLDAERLPAVLASISAERSPRRERAR